MSLPNLSRLPQGCCGSKRPRSPEGARESDALRFGYLQPTPGENAPPYGRASARPLGASTLNKLGEADDTLPSRNDFLLQLYGGDFDPLCTWDDAAKEIEEAVQNGGGVAFAVDANGRLVGAMTTTFVETGAWAKQITKLPDAQDEAALVAQLYERGLFFVIEYACTAGGLPSNNVLRIKGVGRFILDGLATLVDNVYVATAATQTPQLSVDELRRRCMFKLTAVPSAAAVWPRLGFQRLADFANSFQTTVMYAPVFGRTRQPIARPSEPPNIYEVDDE